MNKIDSTHSALRGLCDSTAIRVAMVVNEAIDQGHLRRADIVRVGKVTQQQAAVDLREIRKRFPDLLDYDASSRRYVLLKEAVEPKWLDVSGVRYVIHTMPGRPDAMRVEYKTGFTTSRQWICFAHTGRARENAGIWWRRMGGELPIPSTPQEGIDRVEELRTVVGIQLKSSGPYPEIVGHRLAPAGTAARQRHRRLHTVAEAVTGSEDRGGAEGVSKAIPSWPLKTLAVLAGPRQALFDEGRNPCLRPENSPLSKPPSSRSMPAT
jgi:hypothetical protein